MHRRTRTKIVGGRALRKNNWKPTPNAYRGLPQITIERERPGPGYRHLLAKRDIVRFVGLLPDWDQLGDGLTTIVLATKEPDADGWSTPGVVAVCPWPRDLWYQLMHVLLHELGHHHDRMTNRSRRHLARGEPYAEKYALLYEARIWDAYLREFGLP